MSFPFPKPSFPSYQAEFVPLLINSNFYFIFLNFFKQTQAGPVEVAGGVVRLNRLKDELGNSFCILILAKSNNASMHISVPLSLEAFFSREEATI